MFLRFLNHSLLARYTAITALATVVLLGGGALFLNRVLEASIENRLIREVDVDLAGLVDIYASSGRAELTERIEDRLGTVASDQPHYYLGDAAGNRAAGNIARLPPLSTHLSQGGKVTLATGEKVFARATMIGPDTVLVVAHEYGTVERDYRRLRIARWGVGALLLAGFIVIGALLARRLRQRVDRIAEVLDGVDRGEIDRRAELTGPDDEITALARATNRTIARYQALADAHREVTEHTAHEMRTPLAHLDYRLGKLADDETATEPSRALAQVARADIRNIVAMLDSLLDIASSEARRDDFRSLPELDLSQLCLQIGEMYQESTEEDGTEVTLDIAPDVVVRGDRMQLSRMLTNLLDNALRYGRGEGAAGARIGLVLRPGPVLRVWDSGPGIPDGLRDRLFERFARGDHGAAGQGHGLGLALARAIAERHGWRIRLADAGPGALPGKGAVFEIARDGR